MLDFIAIGLGPFNLSLASLLHQKNNLKYVFFEQKEKFDWHAGMQLPNTVLQVPFMADLVSMVDPTSPFSFLNYLRHQHRLYKFYFLEQPHIPRCEYNHYCQWVAEQLDHIVYNTQVINIEPQPIGYRVTVKSKEVQQSYLCRHLVLGHGNVPALPECLKQIQKQKPDQCLHSAHYLHQKKQGLYGDVVVLGSGQSAAEVFMDLFDQQQAEINHPFDLHWFTRSQGFFPMEYAPLGLEHFSPDYIDHFYQLSQQEKDQQLRQQCLLYKGISTKTIREIYQKLYHGSIAGQKLNTHLHSQCELKHAELLGNGKIRLHFAHLSTQQSFVLDSDLVVSATGYRPAELTFMQNLKPYLAHDEQDRWQITQNYRLVHDLNGHIFVQNQEMHTHGVGTPDLGLGAFRAAQIINQLLQTPLYDLGMDAQVFQHFDVSQNPKICLTTEESTRAHCDCQQLKKNAALNMQNLNSKSTTSKQSSTSSRHQLQPEHKASTSSYEKLI